MSLKQIHYSSRFIIIMLMTTLCSGCQEYKKTSASTSWFDMIFNQYARSVIYYNNFDDDSTGLYSDLSSDWGNPTWNAGVNEGRAQIIEGTEAFQGKSLKILYPRDKIGVDSGVLWTTQFDAGYNELYCSYRIKFSIDFEFVKGGKLPGLAGGAGNTGGNRPNGFDGWSTRIMWRQEGQLVQYVYHPDQPTIYGEDFEWDCPEAIPGSWYQVETRIVMNTPSEYNGIVQSWLNGIEVLNIRNIKFRETYDFSIDALKFHTFFGGNELTWAPNNDVYIYFDEFVVSTAPITH